MKDYYTNFNYSYEDAVRGNKPFHSRLATNISNFSNTENLYDYNYPPIQRKRCESRAVRINENSSKYNLERKCSSRKDWEVLLSRLR